MTRTLLFSLFAIVVLLAAPRTVLAQPYSWTPMVESRGLPTLPANVLRVVNLGTTHVESMDLPNGITLGSGDIDPLTGHYFLITDAGTGEFAQGPLRLVGLRPWTGTRLRFSPDGAFVYVCTGAVYEATCSIVRRADEAVVGTRAQVWDIAFDASGGHVVVMRTAATLTIERGDAADPTVVVWSRTSSGIADVAVRGDRVYLAGPSTLQAIDSATGNVLVSSTPAGPVGFLAAGTTSVYSVETQSVGSPTNNVVRLVSYDASTLAMETAAELGGPFRPPAVADLAMTADDAALVYSEWALTSMSGTLRDPVTLARMPGGGHTGSTQQPFPVISSHPLCRLAVSPPDVVLPSTGGAASFAVTPDAGCGIWPVATGNLFAAITGPHLRTGADVVTVWSAPNPQTNDAVFPVLLGGVSAGVVVQATQVAPDAPTEVRVDRSSGSGRVHWVPSGSGPTPTGFIVEGGPVDAPLVARFALPASARSFGLPPLAAGEYVVQVRAVNAVGEGAASVPARFSVDATTVPEAPTDMVAETDATVVRAQWTAGAGGAAAERFVIEAAPAAQGPGATFVPVAVLAAGETKWAGAVPANLLGEYRLRVRAENAAGSSAGSGSVVVAPSACVTAPAAPSQLHVMATGSLVSLSWDAPAGGAESFVLEAGSQPGLANLAVLPTATPALALTLPASSGGYFVQVRGRSACGTGPASAPTYVFVQGS